MGKSIFPKDRSRQRRALSAWLLLYKPKNLGSTEAVAKIKRLYQAKKAGHAGTLDPLAYGVLPIALGDATKTIPYVMDGPKTYRFTLCWGTETSTHDLEGIVTQSSAARPQKEQIEDLLSDYRGSILQVPPQFSAVKSGGRRAYDLARAGEKVVLAPRRIEIYSFKVLSHIEGQETRFEVCCSKGTYIRAFARDIGRALGCFAYVSDLERTEVFPFLDEACITLEQIETPGSSPFAQQPIQQTAERQEHAKEANSSEAVLRMRDRFLLPSEKALRFLAEGLILEHERHLLEHGQAITWVAKRPTSTADEEFSLLPQNHPLAHREAELFKQPYHPKEAFVTEKGRLRALGTIEAGRFKPRRLFCVS